jgi:hypothetical protein
MKRLLAVLVIAALAPRAAIAEDFPVTGKKLVMVRTPSGNEVFVFISRDVIRAPLPFGAEDPTLVGATLVVRSGNSSESFTFDLPADHWTRNTSATTYRYRNTQAPSGPSAVKMTRIRNGSLLKVSAKATGITLNEASQGSIELLFTSGTRRYCATFGGTIVRDMPDRFYAKDAPAPGACPATPTTSSTVTTFTTVTSTISTSSTSTSSTSTSSTLAAACPPPQVSIGNAGLTIVTGTTDCGGPGLMPNSAPPQSGAIFDGNDVKLADLGLGCFYAGDGLSNALPASQLVPGTTNYLSISSVNESLTAFVLAASDGTGPLNCSRGASAEQHCYNGHPGTNGMGLCTTDADCGSDQDYCLPLANCYFGAPIPLRPSSPAFNSCVLQAILTDACASINLDDLTASLSVALGVRMYLTQNEPPCPACVNGMCNSGERAGQACSGGFGPEGTTIECPPGSDDFIGQLLVNPLSVTSGTAEMVADSEGNFCPGQRQPGIFGTGFSGRRVRQIGNLVPSDPTSITVQLGGNLCLGSSGAQLVDGVVGLPGPSSASVTGSIEICVLPQVCNTICNPCTLGPLCDLICNPCLLCVP